MLTKYLLGWLKKSLPRNLHKVCTSVAPSSEAADACVQWNKDLDLTSFCAFLEYKSVLKLGSHFVSPCGWWGREAGVACGSEVLRKWVFFAFLSIFSLLPARCSPASSLLRAPAAASELLRSFLGALYSSHKYIFPPEILSWVMAGVCVGGWCTEGWGSSWAAPTGHEHLCFARSSLLCFFLCTGALLLGASHLFQSTKKGRFVGYKSEMWQLLQANRALLS